MSTNKRELTEINIAENLQENIDAKKVANYGYDPVAGEWRRLKVNADGTLDVDIDMATEGLATEATLAKTVGFDKNSDISTTITTAGTVKTIVQDDGVKTLTTVIDSTDPNAKTIEQTWGVLAQ